MDDARPNLISTMPFDPLTGLLDLDDHLASLKTQAGERGYPFDRHAVRNELQAATFRLRDARSVRLLVSPTGTLAIEVSAPVG